MLLLRLSALAGAKLRALGKHNFGDTKKICNSKMEELVSFVNATNRLCRSGPLRFCSLVLPTAVTLGWRPLSIYGTGVYSLFGFVGSSPNAKPLGGDP